MPDDARETVPERKHEHVIFIEGKEFKVDTDAMNGAQIKALGGVPSDYQLFLEQKGEDRAGFRPLYLLSPQANDPTSQRH